MAAMLATGGCGGYNHDGRAVSLAGLRGTAFIVTAGRIPIQTGFGWALDVVSSLFGC